MIWQNVHWVLFRIVKTNLIPSKWLQGDRNRTDLEILPVKKYWADLGPLWMYARDVINPCERADMGLESRTVHVLARVHVR